MNNKLEDMNFEQLMSLFHVLNENRKEVYKTIKLCERKGLDYSVKVLMKKLNEIDNTIFSLTRYV